VRVGTSNANSCKKERRRIVYAENALEKSEKKMAHRSSSLFGRRDRERESAGEMVGIDSSE